MKLAPLVPHSEQKKAIPSFIVTRCNELISSSVAPSQQLASSLNTERPVSRCEAADPSADVLIGLQRLVSAGTDVECAIGAAFRSLELAICTS
jgi:hypothetical protein